MLCPFLTPCQILPHLVEIAIWLPNPNPNPKPTILGGGGGGGGSGGRRG